MSEIGILAVQGAFLEHEQALPWRELRQKKDLEAPLGGLILPGGESTVMGKLLRELELFSPLREAIQNGLPVFGTCAGLILLASRLQDGERPHLATMSISARRNAYGRQLGSFHTEEEFRGIGKVPMTFIRAPYIEQAWGNAEILAAVDGKSVAARQGNQLVTAFHPELTDSLLLHRYFLEMVLEAERI